MQPRQPRRDERAVDGERAAAGIPVVPTAAALQSALVRAWRLVTLRGVLNVLVGLLALLWPGITFVALVLLFGAYAFADGVLALVSAFGRRQPGVRRWPLVLEGVVGIGAGLVTAFLPGITAAALLALVAAWAIVGGAFEIIEAVRLRKQIEGEWLLGLAGALSVVFGILVLLFPAAGALSVAWLIGAYALAFGVLLIALGLRLRRFARLERAPASPA
jgi:uncharacterized membrane protein HdeD (DUF308 family)